MALTLERLGHIRRQPGVARSIEVLLAPEDLPVEALEGATIGKRPQPTVARLRSLQRDCVRLANDGQDTRALQQYLGHKNIQRTVRYTELAADRFKSFWENEA
jgi:integrase